MCLITTDGRIYENHLIIKLTVPLPGATRYLLKRMYPTPIIVNKFVSAVFMPRSIYTAESEDKNSYVAWTNEETRNCIEISSGSNHGLNVCPYNGPISMGGSNDCEQKHNNMSETQNSNCPMKLIPTPHLWIVKTEQNNKWLFFAGVSQKFNILCQQSNPQAIFLFGSGLLTLKNGCEATSLEIKLPFQNHVVTSSTLEFPEATQIEVTYDTDWIRSLPSRNMSSVKAPKSLIGNHDSFTAALSQGISDINKLNDDWEMENIRTKNTSYGLHVTAHSYAILFIFVVLALSSAYLLYKFNPLANAGKWLGHANNVRRELSRRWSRNSSNDHGNPAGEERKIDDPIEMDELPKPLPRSAPKNEQNVTYDEQEIEIEQSTAETTTIEPSRVSKLIDSLHARKLSFKSPTRKPLVSQTP